MDETLSGGNDAAAKTAGATTAGAATGGVTTAGTRLRAAREAAGLSLPDIAARTRVPLRQLEAVEHGRYADLPSPTYAVGFARAYARAVGVDEVATAASVRDEIARLGPRAPEYVPYELPDPARVPSRGLAVLGAGAALALLILFGLWYGTDLFRARPGAPVDLAAPSPIATAAVPAAAPVADAATATAGQVRLTASDEVWLRVYDTDDKTLFLGTMKPGDHFDVPADAKGPMINVGRPDKLAVTLDGRPVASLGKGDRAIKDVRVDGASLAARQAGAAAPTPTSTPTTTSTPMPTPTSSSASFTGEAHPTRNRDARRDGSRARARPALTETQRANLEAAAAPPAATGDATP